MLLLTMANIAHRHCVCGGVFYTSVTRENAMLANIIVLVRSRSTIAVHTVFTTLHAVSPMRVQWCMEKLELWHPHRFYDLLVHELISADW